MTCDFTSFSKVFQSYQDDSNEIMKCCLQRNFLYGCKDFRLEEGSKPGPLDQLASALHTELPRIILPERGRKKDG